MTRQSDAKTDQVAEILHQLLYLKARLKVALPDNLISVQQRLSGLRSESGTRRATDYDLIYRICSVLFRAGRPLSMGELHKGAASPLSTATRMVDWLLENGYAERLSDAQDRRIVRVALTNPGRELYQSVDDYLRRRAELLLRRFSASERESLVLLLRKMREALDGGE